MPPADTRFVSAIVRLPPGAQLRDFADGIETRTASRGEPLVAKLRRPLVWGDLSTTDQATFWPVVLDFQGGERDEFDISRIGRALDALSQPVRRASAANGAEGEPSFALGPPMLAHSVQDDVAGTLSYAADPGLLAKLAAGGKAVIVAVIDDGIPFAHRNLRVADGDGSRVEFCWLQSAEANPSGHVPFGREFTRGAIDELVRAHGPDEDAIYLRAGAVEQGARRIATINHAASHGAHVLDAAAGRRPDDGGVDLDLLRIIAVQLPAAVTADTSGYRKDAFILSALHYIFDRADRFAATHPGDEAASLPLIVNLSYGYTGGPHDGTDALEIAMSRMIEARQAQGKPTTLVMPAGNSFAERLNGEISADRMNTGEAHAIAWCLQPNDRTSSYLELWLPKATGATRFQLSITDPDGASSLTGATLLADCAAADQQGDAPALSSDVFCGEQRVGGVVIAAYNAHWTRILIALAPTEPDDASLSAAPAGRWTIGLAKVGGADLNAPVGCRIQRDFDPFGYARGARQSYFDDPLDARFTEDGAPARVDNPAPAFVRRLGTLNGIATHAHVTVVSGYYGDTGRATEYAGAGRRRRPGSSAGPGDVRMSAASDDSTALRGVLAAGTRSGSTARLSGTSMAAPQISRWIAVQHLSQNPMPAQPVPLTFPSGPIELDERTTRLS
ncbi:S8 family serine peptidase [Bosea sp. NBC_00550]|uniref:S8 family serine peptidase n=1 Tax=Bosea sp. NBC_00550 TaxID=2969621 RepID=UPI00222FF579|nr:S8 family serine peptidase [Bosea sp. NBC_00550]UZF95826.1 S8 family serine peptidase [Bosea sp. NBC_00550]